MTEVLVVPELRDEIAKFGIPNYQFLRCLNHEFHKIWNSMFYSSNIPNELNGEEYRKNMGNARILKIKLGNGRYSQQHLIDVFPSVTYIKFSRKIALKQDIYDTLVKFKKLQAVDFSGMYIHELRKTDYKKINFVHCLKVDSHIDDLNLDENDLVLIPFLENIARSNEKLVLINDGKINNLTLDAKYIDTDHVRYARNLVLTRHYWGRLNLSEKMTNWAVQNLTIMLEDVSPEMDSYVYVEIDAMKESIFRKCSTLKSLEIFI